MTIDKFTKWIKAKPIARVRSKDTVEFFLDIVYRFGAPNSIIIDNGTLFTGKKFLRLYDDYDIQVDWAFVAHPWTHGQVEHVNAMIL